MRYGQYPVLRLYALDINEFGDRCPSEQKVITCHLGSLLFCGWGDVDSRIGRMALLRPVFGVFPSGSQR